MQATIISESNRHIHFDCQGNSVPKYSIYELGKSGKYKVRVKAKLPDLFMINCVLYVFLIFQEIGQWVNNCKYENFEGLKLDQRFTKRFESLCRPDCRQGMVKKLQWQSCCYTCANRTARQIIEPSGLASDCQWGSWPDDDLSRCHPLTQRPLGKRNDYVFF